MKLQKNIATRIARTLLAAGLFAAFAITLPAADYTWTTTGTTGHDWTGDNAKWSPSDAPAPSATTDNATFSGISSGTTININTDVSINNLSATVNGSVTLTLRATGGARAFTLNGTLTKSSNSNTVAFISNSGSEPLALSLLGGLSSTSGTYRFGGTTDANALGSLTVGGVNMGTSSATASAIDLNIAADYSLGAVSFTGANSTARTINLVNNTGAAQTRTATVSGLTQTTGSAAVIAGSKVASNAGTHAATLKINTAAATTFTATTQLADGTGGTLALLKTGVGTQTLSGALAHTGGTTVEAGTLEVSGTLAPGGDLTVLANATFAATNALSVHDLTLECGAILGFDLNAAAFPTLSLGGGLLSLKDDNAAAAAVDAGPATFTIDFRNTGVFDKTYAALLSIAGAGVTNDFAGATLSYKNFGVSGQSGTLSFDQLTNGFSIVSAAVPEPAACILIAALAALVTAGVLRHKKGDNS
jgi:autotransporter-associated beta strand protein